MSPAVFRYSILEEDSQLTERYGPVATGDVFRDNGPRESDA